MWHLIDSFPAHLHIENLKSIKLFFLPPNTSYESRRNKIIESKVLQEYGSKDHQKLREKQCPARKLNLKPMQMLVSARNAVSMETIVSFFVKLESLLQMNKQLLMAKMNYWMISRMRLILYEIFSQIWYQKISTKLHYFMLTLKLPQCNNHLQIPKYISRQILAMEITL